MRMTSCRITYYPHQLEPSANYYDTGLIVIFRRIKTQLNPHVQHGNYGAPEVEYAHREIRALGMAVTGWILLSLHQADINAEVYESTVNINYLGLHFPPPRIQNIFHANSSNHQRLWRLTYPSRLNPLRQYGVYGTVSQNAQPQGHQGLKLLRVAGQGLYHHLVLPVRWSRR